MYNTTFIKYFYIFILFCVVFVAIFNEVTEAVGFKFLTGIQSLFTVLFLFQLLNDNAKDIKALRIDIPETQFTRADYVNIPLYWVILPGLILQLIDSIYITLTTNFLQDKYNRVKLTRDNNWMLGIYKWLFIVATIAVTFLIYSFCNDFNTGLTSNNFSGSYKTLLLLGFFITIIFPSINYAISKKLSKLQFSTTQ
jgi:hypothetical protein